jgi:antitoxin (DNA-binding transcriptional repressor) of toxin-antitoxin stability system
VSLGEEAELEDPALAGGLSRDYGRAQSVSTRLLSHSTTTVLKMIEEDGEPVAVTRHNRVVAAIIPKSAARLVHDWLARRPGVADAMFGAIDDPDMSSDSSSFFDGVPPKPASKRDRKRSAEPIDVGVREFAKSTSHLLKAVESGQFVLIRRHSRIVGYLIPCSRSEFFQLRIAFHPDFAQSVSDLAEKAQVESGGVEVGEIFDLAELDPVTSVRGT